MNKDLIFSDEILFIEFFIREHRFYGKGNSRPKLPPDSFFYTGRSKSCGIKGCDDIAPSLIGFEDDMPYLSESILEDDLRKIFKDNANVVYSASEEYVDDLNRWWKGQSRMMSNKTGLQGNQRQLPYANFKSIAPFGFTIENVDQSGQIETSFPRKNISLYINVGQTVCFLCRKEERGDGEWYSPNINLVLFVRNYGFHKHIAFRPQADINRFNSQNMLCNRPFSIRDFRKSALDYELG